MAPLEGVLILKLEPGSPADQAGLKPSYQTHMGFQLGDEILAIAGKKVDTPDDVMAAVDQKAIGETIEVTYRRRSDGTEAVRRTSLRLAERPVKTQQVSSRGQAQEGGMLVSEPDARAKL